MADEKKEIAKKELEKVSARSKLRNYGMMTLAVAVYSAGISLFLDPNSLAPGGLTGIAIILNKVLGMETGTLILLLNIPIFILGGWKFGFRFIVSTIYCTVLVSVLTNILAGYGAVTNDPLLAAVAGSTLVATGLGWVFKAGGTTGGMDIVVKVLRLKFPYLKTGVLFLIGDAAVVAVSALVLKDMNRALYAGIAVFVASHVLDLVLYGRDEAKLIYIISDNSQSIAGRILEELHIGVTFVKGVGAYSGKEKNVILCVMKKQLSPRAEEIIKQEDPLAFMIVSSANEIYGEGYKSYFSEKL